MVVKCCIRFRSKKVAHFHILKWHQFLFLGCASDSFRVKKTLKDSCFLEGEVKTQYCLVETHEMVDHNSSRSFFKDWRLADERGKETLHPYISAVCALFSPMFKILL